MKCRNPGGIKRVWQGRGVQGPTTFKTRVNEIRDEQPSQDKARRIWYRTRVCGSDAIKIEIKVLENDELFWRS